MKGQTIIEVLIALGVGVVILTALTSIVLSSLTNVQRSSSESDAARLAQEGMEVVKSMRSNDWNTYSSLSGDYCLAASCSAITTTVSACGPKTTTCGLNVASKYVREVNVSVNNASCVPPGATVTQSSRFNKVTVLVNFGDNKCTDPNNPYCHTSAIESCLSANRLRSSP